MLAIDIETTYDETVLDLMEKPVADSRLKDPLKIEEDVRKKQEKLIEQACLNALYGKIVCIGYYGDNIQEVDFGSEKKMIENFIKRVVRTTETVVTWNGYGFDIPFIFKRGLKYNLCKLTDMQFYISKNNNKVIDLMTLFAGWGKYEKLDNVAKVLLNDKKEEFDVKKISELIKTDSGKEMIRRYCLKDCELTYKLGQLMI